MSTCDSYMNTLLTDAIKFVQQKKEELPEVNDNRIRIAVYFIQNRTF
jgi:small nuclear ribonucleoprotein (snRNP)-like protein